MDNPEEKVIIMPNTSMRITALRFLLTMLVVFIHNYLTEDVAVNYYHLEFREPAFISWIKFFVCDFLGRAAVPLFFLFAGYLQFKKKDSYSVLLKKKIKSLLIPYVIWTGLCVLAYFIGQSIPSVADYFQNENNSVRDWNVNDWLNLFWIHDNDMHPLVSPLWFVRDLLILVILSPLLSFFARRFTFALTVIVIICFFNGLPLQLDIALLFYLSGFFLAEYDIDFFTLADKISWLNIFILFLLELIVRILFSDNFSFFGFDILISCLFFLKISEIIVSKPNIFNKAKYLAGFSFFLYAIHAPFIVNVLNKISYRVIPLFGIGCLVQFIIPPFITIVLGTLFGIILKKLCPPLFAILSGGR